MALTATGEEAAPSYCVSGLAPCPHRWAGQDTRPEIWKSRRQGGPTIVTDDTTAGKPLNGYVCGTYVDSGRRARLRFSTLRSSYDYRGPHSG